MADTRPLGKPLARTEAEIDEAAMITPADIATASKAVAKVAPKLAKLLDAKLAD